MSDGRFKPPFSPPPLRGLQPRPERPTAPERSLPHFPPPPLESEKQVNAPLQPPPLEGFSLEDLHQNESFLPPPQESTMITSLDDLALRAAAPRHARVWAD